MQFINSFEKAIGNLMHDAPHLSTSFRKSIARNLWWVLAITALALIFYSLYLIFAGMFWGFSAAVHLNLGGVLSVSYTWILAILCALMAVVAVSAVQPLRKMQPKGWRALFLLWMFFTASELIGVLMQFSIMNLLWSVLVVVFFAYVIYEPRQYFFEKSKKKSKSSDDKKPKN